MLKNILVGLLLGATLLSTADAKVYSSRVWEERADFCHKVEATAETVAKVGLSKPLLNKIQSHPAVQDMSQADKLTLFDALYLADKRKSAFWVFDYCMDRLET